MTGLGRQRRRGPARVAPLEVVYHRGGVQFPGHVLCCDTFVPGCASFVSHAYVRIPTSADQFIVSDVTAKLLGDRARDGLSTPVGRAFSLGAVELTLLRSGFVPGAACLSAKLGEHRMLYAGAINPRAALGGEPSPPRRCDVLILESMYGDPRFAFPEPEVVLREVARFCRDAIADGATPVLLTTVLGKAQLLGAHLTQEGLSLRAHRRIYQYARRYRALGLPVGAARRFEGTPRPDEVVLWPVDAAASGAVRKLRRARFALVSGAAQDPERLAKSRCEVGFVLSDHADFGALVEYALAAQAGQVYLLPGRPAALAEELRHAGLSVSSLGPAKQLELF